MKIKQCPQDFVVEEVWGEKLKDSGAFQIFLLEKQGLDTFSAKRIIGKEFKVPLQEIGIGGLKDKHALTRQYMSIPSKYQMPVSWSQKSISFKKYGFVDEPILLGKFQFNKFTIVVRDIKEGQAESLMATSKKILSMGVPNYFDNQRFGSLRGAEAFIAKFLIQDNWQEALKIVLTSTSRHDPASIRHCRKAIKEKWGDWKSCMKACKTEKRARRELRIISFLVDHPEDFQGAFALIERELQKLYLAAYQSFLWNETVKMLLKRMEPKLDFKVVEYHAGSFLFPKEMEFEKRKTLEALNVPLLWESTVFPSEEMKFASLRVLKDEGVSLRDLNIKCQGESKSYLVFKEGVRKVWVTPSVVSSPIVRSDELNGSPTKPRYKMTLSFNLPPGSYGTVILKAIGIAKKGRTR